MTVRVFRCRRCGHKMRFSGPKCGYCFTGKIWWQRSATFYVLFSLPAALLGLRLLARL